MTDIQYLDIAEFREIGFLQEVNRRVLHPAGLALEVRPPWSVEDLGGLLKEAHIELDDDALKRLHAVLEYGRWTVGGVWDYRDDPEGMVFGDLDDDERDKAKRVDDEIAKHAAAREALFGQVVQPLQRPVTRTELDEAGTP